MKKICFVTLSRSDYASLRPVMRSAVADPALDARIVVGGSHLISRFGRTIEQVIADGLPVAAVADFLTETDDSPYELACAYARAIQRFVEILTDEQPEGVFVLGDRWEMLAVASAAAMLKLPIIHHSGGDITQGSSDNQTRNALTALAHLHLVALPDHRARLLHMGEEDWRVITTGEPALTELSTDPDSFPDIQAHLGLPRGAPFVLATFHPTSFEQLKSEAQVDIFLQAIDTIPQHIVLTAPNPDSDSRLFFERQKAFAAERANVHFVESLGAQAYYAAMSKALFMIGNSSSGLWEAPSFQLPVVNIGSRQSGRTHGPNVIHAPLELAAMLSAIAEAQTPAFRASIGDDANPYVRRDTLTLILECLKKPIDRKLLLAKQFVDPLTVD